MNCKKQSGNNYQKLILFLVVSLFPLFTFSQVGINTSDPQTSLDVNGNLRIRNVPYSTSTNEVILVVDSVGYVKKSLVDKSVFRGYLSQDFITADNGNAIQHITNFLTLDNPYNDFNTVDNQFTAPVTGFYSLRMNITSKRSGQTTTPNVVFGLAENLSPAADTWVMRFSVPFNYIDGVGTTSNAGVATSFIGVVNLEKGKQYYFGATTNSITILANPSGSTGSGIGTFFELQLIKSQ